MKRLISVIGVLLLVMAALVPAQANAQAKNVIVLISDGWGINQILSTDYYQFGTTNVQSYQSFPVIVNMSNYMIPGEYTSASFWADFEYGKSGYTDSAAAATAMSAGSKTYGGAIGVDVDENKLVHFMQYAEDAGKATGVISSVEFSHATPAAYVAHNVTRNNYADIAREMILDSTCEVIMGAGHPLYDHDGNPASSSTKYIGGMEVLNGLLANATEYDLDGDGFYDNMVEDVDGDGIADPWTFIQDQADFQALMTGPAPKRVLGVPKVYQTLQYNRAGNAYNDLPFADPFISGIPTLAEMTAAAINVLDNDADGFALMVEGGAVDWAGHANALGRLIEEQMDFNDAVDVVVDWVNANSSWDETLVIVTGDHETGYLWGTGSGGTSFNLVTSNGQGNLPNYEYHSGNHSNQVIPFYAKGPGADFFKTTGLVGIDQVRGKFTDNTQVFFGQMAAVGLEPAVAAVGIDAFDATEGATVAIPVYVDMNMGIEKLGSYSFDICWDESLLEYAGIAAGTSGWDAPVVNASDATNGMIRISSINPSGSLGKVQVATVMMNVLGDPGDIGKIDIVVNSLGTAMTLVNITDQAYVWDCEYAIKVRPGIWGDVDGNRKVDSFDGLIIASYAIGIDVGAHMDRVMMYGDVDADGVIGLADAYACVLYDVDPSNPALPIRIGREFGTVARIALQPAAVIDAVAVAELTSVQRADNNIVVQPVISADTELGAASVLVRWNPDEFTFAGIENAPGLFVANENNVLSGELTMALIDMNGSSELTFPNVILEPVGPTSGMVSIKGLEAIQSGSLRPISIEVPATETIVENGTVPVSFTLDQNVPNPFNPTTTISYSIPADGQVSLAVYSIQGQKVRTLVSAHQTVGSHSVVWDATDDAGSAVSSGMYLYRLTTPTTTTSKRMMLVR